VNTAAPLHPRRLFAVRYCSPAEYALRVTFEIVMAAGTFAALRWIPPAFRQQGLASWAFPWQATAVAVLAAVAVQGVALLRLRGKEPAS
jgi:hypothetical protein